MFSAFSSGSETKSCVPMTAPDSHAKPGSTCSNWFCSSISKNYFSVLLSNSLTLPWWWQRASHTYLSAPSKPYFCLRTDPKWPILFSQLYRWDFPCTPFLPVLFPYNSLNRNHHLFQVSLSNIMSKEGNGKAMTQAGVLLPALMLRTNLLHSLGL